MQVPILRDADGRVAPIVLIAAARRNTSRSSPERASPIKQRRSAHTGLPGLSEQEQGSGARSPFFAFSPCPRIADRILSKQELAHLGLLSNVSPKEDAA